MPAIADITLTSLEVYEPVKSDNWTHYGSSKELNKTLRVSNSVTPAGVLVVGVSTNTPLERTLESAQVADGFNSSAVKFYFSKHATVAECQAEVQTHLEVLTQLKADLAAGKSFY